MPLFMLDRFKATIGLKVENKGGTDIQSCEHFDFVVESINKKIKANLSWAPTNKQWLTACRTLGCCEKIMANFNKHFSFRRFTRHYFSGQFNGTISLPLCISPQPPFLSYYLVFSHYVSPSIGPSITFLFFRRFLGSFRITAPAQSHATDSAVYTALFLPFMATGIRRQLVTKHVTWSQLLRIYASTYLAMANTFTQRN